MDTKIYYCIKHGETRKFDKNIISNISISDTYISSLLIKINAENVKITNKSNADVYICVIDDFCEVLLRDRDRICNIGGNILLEITQGDDSWDEWY